MIKRYSEYIKEASEEIEKSKDSASDEIKADIKEKIESTIKKSGGEYSAFVDKFAKDPESVQIEGLISDDQIYEFWLKFENDIDELLNGVGFFDQSPVSMNVIGVYKYVVSSARKAIELVVGMLRDEISE